MPVWLKLIRPPNLFSIPGDVIAGFALATGFAEFATEHYWQLPLLILSSLLLYVGGLLLNDYVDRFVDAAERPDRPIPSGAVSAPAVRNAAIIVNLLALVLAAAVSPPAAALAALLAICAGAYNRVKELPILGVPIMAACRVLNLLLGAALLPATAVRALPAALISGLFIIVVCLVAKDEAERTPPKWVPPLIPIVVVLAYLPGLPGFNLPGIKCVGVWVAAIMLAIACLATTAAIMRATKPQQIPPQVGSLIRILIIMQAYWIAAAGAPCVIVALVLACWPLARVTGRWFYAS